MSDYFSQYCFISYITPILIICKNDSIYEIKFINGKNIDRGYDFYPIIKDLKLYFSKKDPQFNIKLDLQKNTFYSDILLSLKKIPFGKTISYNDLAKFSGHKNACRATGSALRKNRFPIIIPCHRVIKADNSVGNFSSGATLKKKLLLHEKINIKNNKVLKI